MIPVHKPVPAIHAVIGQGDSNLRWIIWITTPTKNKAINPHIDMCAIKRERSRRLLKSNEMATNTARQ